jgi:hypothetical protein
LQYQRITDIVAVMTNIALVCLALLLFTGCMELVTAPILIAEGAKESYDRRQTEKQEGHPYGRTDLSKTFPCARKRCVVKTVATWQKKLKSPTRTQLN